MNLYQGLFEFIICMMLFLLLKLVGKLLTIIGNFGCKLESNTVYKAYKLIEEFDECKRIFLKI